MTAAVWFRTDLRVKDNEALFRACENHDSVVALFYFTEKQWKKFCYSHEKISLIKDALRHLKHDLLELNIPLLVFQVDDFSNCVTHLQKFLQENKLNALYCTEEYEWDERQRDLKIKNICHDLQINFRSYASKLLLPIDKVLKGDGTFYQVFTPFKKAFYQFAIPTELPKPFQKSKSKKWVEGGKQLDLSKGKIGRYDRSEDEVLKQFEDFLLDKIQGYEVGRDFPSHAGTSFLSPFVNIGRISPRTCWHLAMQHYFKKAVMMPTKENHLNKWLDEMIWREFYQRVSYFHPRVCKNLSFQKKYDGFSWVNDTTMFKSWCQGKTGYPIVDAAMVQLNTFGWMHNRLRMIVAMFLVKHLLIDWRWGEEYFMSQLVDGDFSANNGGWQWCAGCGVDAAPYFRIFNPVTQSQKFDPEGLFIKKMLPQLSGLSSKQIHLPGEIKEGKKIVYPQPIVDHKAAREKCLQWYKGQL